MMEINYIHFDSTYSTNTWAKQNASHLDPNKLTCITAHAQTAGRGRFNRPWLSPKGKNILATFYFCEPQGFTCFANLGQILSLSCIAVLKKNGFYPQIKWPNDILLEGKKISGVLCETLDLGDKIGVVLGIGLNVNMNEEDLAQIDKPATSLLVVSGEVWNCEDILGSMLEQFLRDLSLLEKKGFKPFCAEYEELLAFKGKVISCMDGKERVQGICHSVNSDGTLNLLLKDKKLKVLSAGELQEGTVRDDN